MLNLGYFQENNEKHIHVTIFLEFHTTTLPGLLH